MQNYNCVFETQGKNESKTLIILLAINGFMFVTEFILGWYSESTGLIADSLDMLADAMVYGVALYVIGRSTLAKVNSAMLSGIFQMILGVGVIVEIIRRFILGSEPISFVMIVVSLMALAANMICLVLINQHKNGEIHMLAARIFSTNDIIANMGVITAGILVFALESSLPDLFIGAVISVVVLRGSYQIIREAKQTKGALVT